MSPLNIFLLVLLGLSVVALLRRRAIRKRRVFIAAMLAQGSERWHVWDLCRTIRPFEPLFFWSGIYPLRVGPLHLNHWVTCTDKPPRKS